MCVCEREREREREKYQLLRCSSAPCFGLGPPASVAQSSVLTPQWLSGSVAVNLSLRASVPAYSGPSLRRRCVTGWVLDSWFARLPSLAADPVERSLCFWIGKVGLGIRDFFFFFLGSKQ